MDAVKNFAKGTVSDGNYDEASTSIDLLGGGGARLPAAPFNAVWWNATDYPDPSDDPNVEIVRVTAISTDTLTITRGQEGTAAVEHNTPGKTYQFIAAPTKKTIDDLMALLGDIFGSDTAVLVNLGTNEIYLRQSGTSRYMLLSPASIEIQGTKVVVGDLNGEQNSVNLMVDDDNLLFRFFGGQIASDQIQSATIAVGTLAGKLAIHNGAGTLVGYIPIYGSIT